MNLRVLHLVPSVGSKSGGLGPASLGLVQAQRECGLDSRIWCLEEADGSMEAAASYGLSGVLTAWPRSGPAVLGYSSRMHAELLSSSSSGFDIIHQHSMWLGYSHATASAARTIGCPTVIAPEGCLDAYALRLAKLKKWIALQLYEKRNLNRARCVYALSDAEASSIRAFGLTNDIAILPNGVSADWLERGGDGARFKKTFTIDPDKRIVLYVGRLHPKKGLELLIHAASGLRKLLGSWVIVIVGEGNPAYRKALVDLVEENGLQDLVRFVGPLYGQEKRDAFDAASVFVLPSYSEGAPMAVLEALAAAVPVITTYSSPWSELESNGCGWWVEATQEGIKGALHAAVQNSQEGLQQMGRQGRELVREKYTWRKIAEQTALLYQYLRHGGPRPSFLSTEDSPGREQADRKAA
jgi:glycosyltransferase involved in cell wall biosynthesis